MSGKPSDQEGLFVVLSIHKVSVKEFTDFQNLFQSTTCISIHHRSDIADLSGDGFYALLWTGIKPISPSPVVS